MRLRKSAFCVINILLPLILGAIIYILLRPKTIISHMFYSAFSVTPKYFGTNALSLFFKNYFCDFLWSYSLTFSLLEITKYTLASMLTAFALGCAFEIAQCFSVISGTADILDVFIECAGTIIAFIIFKRGDIK